VPPPQVAFHRTTETDWTWFTESELGDPKVVELYKNAEPGSLEIRTLGPSLRDSERLIDKLIALGIKYQQRGEITEPIVTDGTILTKIVSEIDSLIFRAVAKIAFNYAAKVQRAEFVLRSDFDAVREYIRYGHEPDWAPVVMPTCDSILFGDSRRWRQTIGHLVTLDWNRKGDGIVAQVSLFNTITYRVLLCPFYSGIWDSSLRSGHHFDTETRKISVLSRGSVGLLPLI
jgi:hypothetical protein